MKVLLTSVKAVNFAENKTIYTMNKLLAFLAPLVLLWSCTPSETATEENTEVQDEVQTYLDSYNAQYQELYEAASEAQWRLNTYIKEGDTTANYMAQQAEEAYASFTGSHENINKARGYLKDREALSPLQVKQLEKILYMAANNPETLSELVKERIAAENRQTEKLFGYNFQYNGKSVSTNFLDSILRNSTDPQERLAAWTASKEVGKQLREGLIDLQNLRNQTVRGLGYPDYFTYQVSDYGMSTQEMRDLNQKFLRELWPLYRELHTYARYELADEYNAAAVPELLPAHWLPNRWGQEWSPMIEVEGLNLDEAFASKDREWIVKEAENFYTSMGFPELPQSFYEKSSLYPLPADADYKKNNHASAWHMDL